MSVIADELDSLDPYLQERILAWLSKKELSSADKEAVFALRTELSPALYRKLEAALKI